MEYELQIAHDLRICNQIFNYSDSFPYNNLLVFTRNQQIQQALNARQWKRKIQADQDART